MKRFIILLMGLLIQVSVIVAMEEEKLPRPEEAQNHNELQKTMDQLQNERLASEKYIKTLEPVRDKAELQREEERIKLIDYTIGRAQALELKDYYEDVAQKFTDDKGTLKRDALIQYRNGVDEKLTLADYFNKQYETSKTNLTREYSASPTPNQVANRIEAAAETLNTTVLAQPEKVTNDYFSKIDDLKGIIDKSANVQALINAGARENLTIFRDASVQLAQVSATIDDEIESAQHRIKIEEGNTKPNAENLKQLNTYLSKLNSFKTIVANRLDEIGQTQLEASGVYEKPSFWRDLFKTVENAITKLFSKAVTPDQIIKQIKSVEPNLAPVANIVATVDGLANRTQDLLTQANVERNLKIQGRQPGLTQITRDRLTNLRDTLNKFKATFNPAEQAIVEKAYNQIQQLSGDANAYMAQRYKGKYPTLFDKLYAYYSSDSIFGDTNVKPNQAYEALGLKPGASTDAIEAAIIARKGLPLNTSEGIASRNASFLLGNPISKVAYDAFLNDYNRLMAAAFDPAGLKTDAATKLLSDTKKIEINKDSFNRFNDEIWPMLEPVLVQAGTLKSQIGIPGENPPIFTHIGQLVNQIDTMLKQ